jgi:hypothetical protein
MIPLVTRTVFVLVLAACGAPMPAPVAPANPAPAAQPTSVGGYVVEDVNGKNARDESANAIELLRAKQNDASIALQTIRSFGSQIVNGMNYRFELDVTTASGPRAITLVMYESGDPGRVHREISSVTGL